MDDTHRAEVRQWLIGIPDLAAAFARLDLNGDGLLSRPELQALVDYGVLSGSACNALMYMGDTDGDGQINLDEFQALGEMMRGNEQLKAELGLVQGESARCRGARHVNLTQHSHYM